MFPDYSPVVQCLQGTLLTWGLTAAGAGLVFFMKGTQRKLLDASLGFAAGVMLAASFWSLLAPAIEMAESSGMYGESGEHAYAPVAVGFFLGAMFVYLTDVLMTYFKIGSSDIILAMESSSSKKGPGAFNRFTKNENGAPKRSKDGLTKRHVKTLVEEESGPAAAASNDEKLIQRQGDQWRRVLLLVIAVTVHNIPEGLAVGVAFGAIGKSSKATFESARNLAIGIGIQNFPEGLAVSLPLRGTGMSLWKSFWYGQLSGMVEPVAGLVGVVGVSWIEPALPYALAFAAGAMIYVVCDDLIPEASTCGNGRLATWGAILGFIVMMCLDVGLA